MINQSQSKRIPRITIIGYKSFSRLMHSLIPDYQGRAEINIIDKIFDEALEEAQTLADKGETDIIISAGANGAYLRDSITIPSVMVQVTEFDLLQAFIKARQVSDQIALVSYYPINHNIDVLNQLLGIDIEQRSYRTIEDAQEKFRELASKGYKVIIGSSLVVNLAEKEDLVGILVYSVQSGQEAIDRAIELAHITQIEEARTERVNTILHHLSEGVVAVDQEERIQFLNPAMASLLGISEKEAIGKNLGSLVPSLSLDGVLRSGKSEVQKIQKIKNKIVVTNRIPIKNKGGLTGAVLTLQDSSTIEQADRNIRSQNRSRRFVAKYHIKDIVCVSSVLEQAKSLASQYAKTDSTVLLTGESGTKKELFAQGIHNLSPRKNRPFVAINCAAIPSNLLESELFGYEEGAFTGSLRGGKSGLFEMAHTGTIFLDEVGDMPLELQSDFLRVLQEKEILRIGGNEPIPVDVRIIAATNKDLKSCVKVGQFREELYYRLNILHIQLPSLSERKEDIPVLVKHLLQEAHQKIGSAKDQEPLSQAILPYFERYSWPGNVREMENFITRLTIFCSELNNMTVLTHTDFQSIIPEIFEEEIGNPTLSFSKNGNSLPHFNAVQEQNKIAQVLAECHGKIGDAARILGISRTTLWRKQRKYQQLKN